MKLTSILSSAFTVAVASITLVQPAQSFSETYRHPSLARLQLNAMSFARLPAPSKLSTRGSNPASQPAPISPAEQRKIKIQISKSTFVKRPNGYGWTDATVCSKEVPYNIYDLRGSSGPWPTDGALITCDSDFAGQPVKLVVGGSGGWYTTSIFQDEPASDFFSANIFLVPDSSKPIPKTFPVVGAGAASRDLHPRSILLSAFPELFVSCTNAPEAKPSPLHSTDAGDATPEDCTTSIPEFFYVTAEIKD